MTDTPESPFKKALGRVNTDEDKTRANVPPAKTSMN